MEDWAKRRLAELKAAAPKKRAANKKKNMLTCRCRGATGL